MASQRKFRETSEMAAMASRVIKAIGRRVGEEDASSLVYLMTVQTALDNAWRHAVDGIRETGSPDKDIAEVLGVTRQAVQQRWPWPESAA